MRQTITDLTTDDRVYIQGPDGDGITMDPGEAILAGKELIGLALELMLPGGKPTIAISLSDIPVEVHL